MQIKQFLKKIGNGIASAGRKLGKKNLILIGAVLIIGAAVVVNILLFGNPAQSVGYGSNNMEDNYTAGDADAGSGSQESSYFASTQLSRQRARDEALEVLLTVVDSNEALAQTKERAMSDISRIASDIEKEANIETLVVSKGFAECVAVVNGSSVSIVVKTDGLLPSEVSQISEIVYEQTGILPTGIRIIEQS